MGSNDHLALVMFSSATNLAAAPSRAPLRPAGAAAGSVRQLSASSSSKKPSTAWSTGPFAARLDARVIPPDSGVCRASSRAANARCRAPLRAPSRASITVTDARERAANAASAISSAVSRETHHGTSSADQRSSRHSSAYAPGRLPVGGCTIRNAPASTQRRSARVAWRPAHWSTIHSCSCRAPISTQAPSDSQTVSAWTAWSSFSSLAQCRGSMFRQTAWATGQSQTVTRTTPV